MRIFVTLLATAAVGNGAPTFYKDVIPVVQRDCQNMKVRAVDVAIDAKMSPMDLYRPKRAAS